MQTELKNAIIKHIQENSNDFQLVNNTTAHFREYIYDSKGEYLIGGVEVSRFITEFISLYKE